METKIAVRLYNNPKFGKTFGKGMYYNAVFNGTLDFPEYRLKYLIDLVPFRNWQHTATTGDEMGFLEAIVDQYKQRSIDIHSGDHGDQILCSWVKRFDSSMSKPKINGYVIVDTRTCELEIALEDEKNGVHIITGFPMRSCREKNGNSPDYFASNYDVDLKQRIAA